MQSKFRLTRSEDFKRVRRIGKSYAHPLVVLVVQASETSTHVRVGVAAGKTTGTAVHRNRAKRLLREAIATLPDILHFWLGPDPDRPPAACDCHLGRYPRRVGQSLPTRSNPPCG